MSAKTVLIAHRLAQVRDRFAAALADARHVFVIADTAAAARRALTETAEPVDLVLIDLGLDEDGVELVSSLRQARSQPVPIVIFSGTLTSAAQVPRLAAMQVGFVNEHAATAQILPALAPHLFPDNFNRRASARVTVGVPVSYRAGQTLSGAVTLDIGRGGLAIRTMTPVPKGTALQLKFRLPGGSSDIEALARVSWSDRRTGMGVQFEQVSSIDQRAIDAFVDEHI